MQMEIFTVFISLLGVIGLIFLTYYGTRWLRKRFNTGLFGGHQKGVKIIEVAPVAQDKQLIVVTVGKKNLLLGVTPAAVTKICDLDDEDMTDFSPASENTDSGFLTSFRKTLADKLQNNNQQDIDVNFREEKDGHDTE